MSRIRSQKTKPELRLRKALWAAGHRFRVRSKLPGKPDVIFTRAKLAVFVDGCFWHGCPIHGRRPKSNQGYWHPKIDSNVARDVRVNDRLTELGWKVLRVWEHEIKSDIDSVVQQIVRERQERLP